MITDKDKFLMIMTVAIFLVIIINSFLHGNNNLVKDLMIILSYWLPSPMSNSSSNVYIAPNSKDNSDSGI